MSHFLYPLVHVSAFALWLGLCTALWSIWRAQGRGAVIDATAERLEALLRGALVMVLPSGYAAARELGVVAVPDAFFVALWVISAAWLLLVIATALVRRATWKRVLLRIDVGWSLVLAAGLAWDAWQGSRGRGHLLAGWIVSKFGLLSAALVASSVVRLRLREFALPALLGLIVLALAAAWLGIAKPVR